MQRTNTRRMWNGLRSVGRLRSYLSALLSSYVVLVGHVAVAQTQFTETGPLGTARALEFTLTELCDGTTLIAGGRSVDGLTLASTERFDPGKGTWTATGSLHVARSAHTATLLPDCQVLVVGGAPGAPGATAELYNPQTGVWTVTGNPTVSRRYSHTASLLPSGSVLIAGGVGQVGGNAHGLTNAELYDPKTGTFSSTAPLSVGRYLHVAVPLADGRVLVAGGTLDGGNAGAAATSTEIYDPTLSNWSAAGPMTTGRWQDYTLTLLPNGDVLAAGGVVDWTVATTARAEIFDIVTGRWRPTASMPTTRFGHSATLLTSGAVLVAGGNDHPGAFGTGTTLNTAILFDPAAGGTWKAVDGAMVNARQRHLAQRLKNSAVLIAGGYNSLSAVVATTLYGASIQPPFDCTASDPDGDPLTYEAKNLPPGLTMDPKTCAISGTIAYQSARDYEVQVTASDGSGSTTQRFTWTITKKNVRPVLINPGDQTSAEGAQIELALSANDPNGDPLTFTADGLPPGLTIDPKTGVISGTIQYKSARSYVVTVKVTDDGGLSSTPPEGTFTWTVTHTNRPPVMSPLPDRTNAEGDVIS
jgi:putative Ig domain-containing protein